MDRKIIYPGQIPLETDLLGTNLSTLIALAKLSQVVLGDGPVLNRLACVPDSPPSLNVSVGPGEIYATENVDDTAYSSIPQNTTHQILKQGIRMDASLFACAAPGTGGFSINYLIQIAFAETDTGSTLLEYYNAADPTSPWLGPGNDGVPDFTSRSDQCLVSVKAGAAAATGTQVTPTPDAGKVGAWVVTVANGQTTILSGDITVYSGAPFITERLGDKISKATADTLYEPLGAAGSVTVNVAGSSNVTLNSTQYGAATIILTGALTADINVVFPTLTRSWEVIDSTTGGHTVTLKTASGTGVPIVQGTQRNITGDGTNIVASDSLLNLASASTAVTQSAGNNSTQIATTAYADAAATAVKPTKYTNAGTVVDISGSETAFTHGLGGVPDIVRVKLVYSSIGGGGYAFGDTITCPEWGGFSSEERGASVRITSTQLFVRFGTSSLIVPNKTTGAPYTTTPSDWTFTVTAIRFA